MSTRAMKVTLSLDLEEDGQPHLDVTVEPAEGVDEELAVEMLQFIMTGLQKQLEPILAGKAYKVIEVEVP